MDACSVVRRSVRVSALYLAFIFVAITIISFIPLSSNIIKSSPNYLLAPIQSRTIDVFQSDEQLRAVYAAALCIAAESISEIAAIFPNVHQLSLANKVLSVHCNSVFTKKESGSSEYSSHVKRDIFSDLFKPIDNLLLGVEDALFLNGPAFFLGVGLGEGGAQGLRIASAEKAAAVADKIIAANNETTSGLNIAIKRAAKGAAAVLVGSINVNSVLNFNTNKLPQIALGLADGIGNGIASGLELSEQAKSAQAPQGDDISSLVGTLGFGISKSIIGNIGFNTTESININHLLNGKDLGQVAMIAGEGLGNGTASGLGLSPHEAPLPTGNNLIDAIGGFSFGISKQLSSSIDLQSLQTRLSIYKGNLEITSMIPLAAMNFGCGISEGVGIGLGLEPDVPTSMTDLPDGKFDIGGMSRNFARGLSASFISNGTATRILESLGGGEDGISGSFGSFSFGRVAQGFARGLAEGVGDGIKLVGGVRAIVEGRAAIPDDFMTAMDINLEFDDSVNGAAAGLGLGLGSQGVLVATRLMISSRQEKMITGYLIARDAVKVERGLIPRQISDNRTGTNEIPFINRNNTVNVSNTLDSQIISEIGQQSVNTLTCKGIGGIFSIGLGLVSSGAININAFVETKDNSAIELLKQFIPEGNIHITNSGHTFLINLKEGLDSGDFGASVTVNGNPVFTLLVFLAIHGRCSTY